jgi:sulfur relay (sulfurtransferase) DsrC/TusE family protein
MNHLKLSRSLLLFLLLIVGSNTLIIRAQPVPDDSANIFEKLNSLEASIEKSGSWFSPSNAIPLMVAFGGWILALYSLRTNRKLQESEKMKEHLFSALKWFEGGEGGTQKRSIGIAIVEAHWNTYKDLRPIWRTILVNQAIHLLVRSKERDSETERNNIDRIMKLLWDEIANKKLDGDLSLNLLKAVRDSSTFDDKGNKTEKSQKGVFIERDKKRFWVTAWAHSLSPEPDDPDA